MRPPPVMVYLMIGFTGWVWGLDLVSILAILAYLCWAEWLIRDLV